MYPTSHDKLADTPAPLAPHLIASRASKAILTVQQETLQAVRDFLHGRGFVELLAPPIGPVIDPSRHEAGASNVDHCRDRSILMTSLMLYKQASLRGVSKLFYVGPNTLTDPVQSTSAVPQLPDFHQIDVELSGATRQHAMKLAEDLLVHVVERVWQTIPDVLRGFGRDPSRFQELLMTPFDSCPHAEAVERLHFFGYLQDREQQIDVECEDLLSCQADRPFFLTDHPKGSAGIYDREDPCRPGTLQKFDLIAHGCFGKLASGSEREVNHLTIARRIWESGENLAAYRLYLEMARAGIPASAGFAMGVERLVRFLAGLGEPWPVNSYFTMPQVVTS